MTSPSVGSNTFFLEPTLGWLLSRPAYCCQPGVSHHWETVTLTFPFTFLHWIPLSLGSHVFLFICLLILVKHMFQGYEGLVF